MSLGFQQVGMHVKGIPGGGTSISKSMMSETVNEDLDTHIFTFNPHHYLVMPRKLTHVHEEWRG